MKLGAILVSLWSGINLALAAGILVSMALLGRHPPSLALFVGEAGVRAADPAFLALVDTLGMLMNAAIAGFCLLVLAVTWKAVVRGVRWAFVAVAASTLLVQAFGFVCDRYLGNRNLVPNLVSAVLLVAALVLARPRVGGSG